MIELPETTVLVKQINETLVGKTIRNAEANHTPHSFAWYTKNPKDYNEKLAGKTITSADVFSGSVRIKADDATLLISTPIRYFTPGEKLPDKHQLFIRFTDGSALTCTVQMWGCMFCWREDETDGIPAKHILNTAPTPLEDAFDEPYFQSLIEKSGTKPLSAKAFLTTEQRITGLGNGVLQDILWRAKIHPKKKLTSMTDDEKHTLFRTVKDVLKEMTDKGGRDTERDLFGNPGGYKTVLSKNAELRLCPTCGGGIVKEAYLGGSIYYCTGCQPLK